MKNLYENLIDIFTILFFFCIYFVISYVLMNYSPIYFFSFQIISSTIVYLFIKSLKN